MIRLLSIAVAVAWIVVVGASYAAVFLFPGPPDIYSRAPIPPDLSPAYLPLLAATLILGIIRQLSRDRSPEARGPSP
jgi:hypothetical protein